MAADFSVAVVGAGPGGSSCANAFLSSGGTGLALIDRARFPRDKSCGDGLSAGVLGVLDRLGLSHIVADRPRIKRMEMNFHGQIRVDVDTDDYDRPSPLGYVLPRMEFDHALVQSSLERGAEDLLGWGLQNATHDGAAWRLQLEETATGATREITADVLVGADGARSRVRRVLHQPFNTDDDTAIAIRAYVDVPHAERGFQRIDVLKELPHPGYAWLFSDGLGRANVGLGCTVVAYKREHPDLRKLVGDYCAALDTEVCGTPSDFATAILPTGFRRMPLGYPTKRAALVGDAGSMINPAAGEGIFFAMYAGLILGEALAQDPGSTALATYDRVIRQAFGRDFRNARILMKLLSREALLSYVVRDFRASPDFYYDFIEFVMGVMPPRRTRSLVSFLTEMAFQRLRSVASGSAAH